MDPIQILATSNFIHKRGKTDNTPFAPQGPLPPNLAPNRVILLYVFILPDLHLKNNREAFLCFRLY